MNVQIKQQTEQNKEQTFKTQQVLTVAGGHFVHDTYSAFVSPLLPLLIEKLSISLTLAGVLTTFIQLPALLNPLIGYVADKVSVRYFVFLAPAITATLASLLGLAPNYISLAILLLMAGVSVACFHAPAPAMIARVAGNQVGKGMSFFMAAGELGRTVGPLLVVWAVSMWSLEGIYRVMPLGWAASFILYWRLKNVQARPEKKEGLRQNWPIIKRLFIPLTAVVVPKSFVTTALAIYLPIFMTQQGAPFWMAGVSLTVWELAGVAGALLSGTLSDYFGRKLILLISVIGSSVFMLIFLVVEGVLIVPTLLLLGFTALSGTPVILAMVQDHLPHNRAVANGLFLTLNFITRVVATLIIGFLGDVFSLSNAYFFSAIITFLAVPAIYYLPKKV